MRIVALLAISFVCSIFIKDVLAAETYNVSSCAQPPSDKPFSGCEKGCEWIIGGLDYLGRCSKCQAGKYKENADTEGNFGLCIDSCTIKPAGDSFFMDEYTGYFANMCRWQITCNGQYFKPFVKLDPLAGFKCADCGAHYHAADENSTCDVEGEGNNIIINNCPFNEICTGYVYKLELNSNTNIKKIDTGNSVIEYENITTYAKFGSGFADQPDSSSWGRLNGFESISVKQLKGYSQNANCSGSVLMPSHVQTSPDKWNWNDIFDFFPDAPNENGEIDVTLYACWNNSQITVIYYTDTAGTLYTDKCGPINDKEDSFECKVEDVQNSGSGVLQGYKCTYVSSSSELPCVSNDPNRLFRVDDAIPLVSTQIILRPQFAPCPAGYYCSNGKSYECPLGTTSTEGAAKAKSDCYMVRGPDGTKFCSKDRCFTLPGYGNILYEP